MIQHPFPPLYDKNSKILILGSFPSVKSREQMFFYGHPQNRFWNVIARVFGEVKPETIDEKKAFILRNNLALWDVLASCEIDGSSDASIKNAVANDITPILKTADIKSIFVNGKAAEKYYNKYIKPKVGRSATVLPSTSPANAAWNVEKLVNEWRVNILIEKDSIRKHMKYCRKHQSKEEQNKNSEIIRKTLLGLEEVKKAKSVCIYMDAFFEVETGGIIDDLQKLDKEIIFPISDVKTNTLTLCRDCGEFKRGAYGILEPKVLDEVSYTYPELVIVPGLAFDEKKNRLGFGAGYYDRFLSENKGIKIGLCYDFQIMGSIPTDEHDIKMDLVISEKREII